ncbi:MAG: Polypeptide-transport-associated domain protein FtsQ-type [Verrucomicrobiaceae bacterium]|nr:Polypeptide-transport-associated domain protein FtsQ-type [Verrucomicrobiaceae bacterium]
MVIITDILIIVLDEPKQSKKKNRVNSTFRSKPKAEDVVRLPLDLEADSPKLRALKQAEKRKRGFRKAAMLLLIIALAALGRAAVNETLLQNPRFTLQEIKVETPETLANPKLQPEPGILSNNQIQAACGLTKGTNLLTVDLSAVRERITQLPAISSVSIKRNFSGRLTVVATQRKPIAWVKCEPLGWNPKHPLHCMVVDAEGIAIPVEVMQASFNDLPMIDDKTIDQITPGKAITSVRFVACMKLLKALKTREAKAGCKLVSVTVPGTFALDARFDNGSTVTFSYDDLDVQLQRYDRFVAEARQKDWNVQSVNLVAMHNVPVNFKITKSATTSLPAAIPVVSQVASSAPASTPPSTRAARNTSSGKSTRKTSSH